MIKQPVPVEVEDYVNDLEPGPRILLYPVLDAVRDAMPPGYVLGMHGGIPGWTVPLSRYPNTHDGEPLAYVSLSAQTHYGSLYLVGLVSDPETDAAFRAEWTATGRTLNMVKSCIRFKTLVDIDLDIVTRFVAGMPVEHFLSSYERARPPLSQL